MNPCVLLCNKLITKFDCPVEILWSRKNKLFDISASFIEISPIELIQLNQKYGGAYFDHEEFKIVIIGLYEIDENLIYKLAHEYGHYLTFKSEGINNQLIEDRVKIKSTLLVLNDEIKAWNNAEVLLKSLDIEMVSFFNYKEECLKSYCVAPIC